MVEGTANWVGLALADRRYLVTARLGAGGMGFVYRVRDAKLDADVVLKVPRASMLESPEFAGRFEREIRSLVRLAHPHIVHVTDVGTHDGVPFAVLQYLSGGSLRDRQESNPDGTRVPVDPASIRSWLPGIADALDFIHGEGYIHRDVKPENILFDGHGHPFLNDFGIAKVVAEESERDSKIAVTAHGLVLGTPHYMAPEFVLGEPYDGRIDQYALGILSYELLAGRYPFDGPTAVAIFFQHKSKEPPPLIEVLPGVPVHMANAVHRALAKAPGERFASCQEFAQAMLGLAQEAGHRKVPAGSRSAAGQYFICPQCLKDLSLPADAWGKRLLPELPGGVRRTLDPAHERLAGSVGRAGGCDPETRAIDATRNCEASQPECAVGDAMEAPEVDRGARCRADFG